MAGAPENNNNAEKWTPEVAQKYLEIIYNYVIENPDCISIQEAACNTGEYKAVIAYIENKYKNTDLIDFNAIKKAEAIIESRTYKKALEGKYNATMAIFGLKNNHGWKDKQDFEHSGGLKNTTSITVQSTDEAEKVKNIISDLNNE